MDDIFEKYKGSVLVTKSPHGTTTVFNYNVNNQRVNEFLRAFDIWGSVGQFVSCGEESYIAFECPKKFLSFAKTEMAQVAFDRMGSKLVVEE